jgi:hypothetical protein
MATASYTTPWDAIELAAYLPFEIGDEGGCAEWPAGSDVLAEHVELPARRVVVEEAAPVWDQVVGRTAE